MEKMGMSEQTRALSSTDAALIESARLLWQQSANVLDRNFGCLAERAVAYLSAWHCPATWIAAAFVIPLLAEDPGLAAGITAETSPDVADLAQRYLALERTEIQVPEGRGGVVRGPYQKLQKLFIASYLDEGLAFLAVAYMLSTLDHVEESWTEGSDRLARDLEIVLLPLLERFGMWEPRRSASDRLFELVRPADAAAIQAAILYYDPRRQEVLNQVQHSLLPVLEDLGDGASLSLHKVRPSRVFEQTTSYFARVRGQTKDSWTYWLNRFASLLAFDVVVSERSHCYIVLGALHQLGRSMPGSCRDYIGSPKFNGYQTLHTTLRLMTAAEQSHNVEFYIGTHFLREANLWGRVLEWRAGGQVAALADAWWHKAGQHRHTLASLLPGDYSSPTYTFTPLGELCFLDQYSTPVDFAYTVHSELGQFYTSAEVNGQEVPDDYCLANGDIVNVRVEPEALIRPRPQWLESTRTPLAVGHIRKQLLRQYGRAREGRRLVENALEQQCQRFGIKLSDTRIRGHLENAVKWARCNDLEALFLRVGDGKLSADAIAVRIISEEVSHRIAYATGEPLRTPGHRIKIAQCCQPAFEDAIVGRFAQPGTRHEQVKIHTSICPLVPRDGNTRDLVWRQPDYQGLYEFLAIGADRSRILTEVLEPFYARGAYLYKLQAERLEDGRAQFLLVVEPEADTADKLKADLEKIADIHECSFRPLAIAPSEIAFRKRSLRRGNPFAYDQPAFSAGEFVGRSHEVKEVKSFIAHGSSASPLIVYGPWRIGKTSLLRYVARYDRHKFNVLAVYLNCHNLVDLRFENLLAEIAEGLWNKIRQEQDLIAVHHLEFTAEDRARLLVDPIRRLQHYFRQVLNVLRDERSLRLAIIIDEFSDLYDAVHTGKLDGRLFSNFRALVEGSVDVRFILALQTDTLYRLRSDDSPGAGLLEVSRLLPLRALEEHAVSDLLVRRARAGEVEFEKGVVERIVAESGANPYLANVLAHEMFKQLLDSRERVLDIAALEASLRDVLCEDGHAHIYFKHLTALLHDELEWAVLRQVVTAGDRGRSATEIARGLRLAGAPAARLPGVVDRLIDKGFLAANPQQTGVTCYRAQVPLFSRWLQSYQEPLSEREQP